MDNKTWYIHTHKVRTTCTMYIYLYDGILFSLKKEGHSDIYYNMDET